MTYYLKSGISGSDLVLDTNGGIYNWIIKNSNEEIEESPFRTIDFACFGWKDKNMYAACYIELAKDKSAHLNLVVKKSKFWTKKNLTYIANVCYKILKAKSIISLTSRTNQNINKVLDKLGFIRNGITIVDGEERLLWEFPKTVLENQGWYLHG